ncbi:site-specific tyrosine recombinase XerD [Parapedobacter indicus]|uniref:Tyrosine recombinase XerC n=1 Tax=Parapedobacter indicus TaxID=1477437 RepID=A0A1I3DJP5_9SPHI|nr:site-specific tyrosine recombinase XerD [Parapedobacter indicus]PPL04710.1 integrase/recombinase XerD [Parapedobacter indicus]SFH86893.1 integrase/recombinase XerD [Parapedobacter indicus]
MDWKTTINGFKHYLQLERAMSANTVEAYLDDVTKLQQFAEPQDIQPPAITPSQLQDFLTWINGFGLSAYSQARILSGIKTFYLFMALEHGLVENPTALIQAPRLGRKIPDILNITEIDSLIGAIDLSAAEGMRNKAMLEVLYGCGLRVSELVGLKISNLFLDVEFIKVEGKGSKERLVPIGTQAAKYLHIYLEETRVHQKIKPGCNDFVFLNRRGSPLTRVMVFIIIKDLAAKIGLTKKISPHTFRHSFASHLVEGGADLRAVQEMLGHESITTTEIYTHIDRDYLRSVIIQYHPRS